MAGGADKQLCYCLSSCKTSARMASENSSNESRLFRTVVEIMDSGGEQTRVLIPTLELMM